MGRAHDVPVSFDNVRDKNLMQLTKLNLAIFPVKYDGRYYTDALSSGDFTKLAYYGDICVGSIACRIERNNANLVRLYIMTLGILAPYRRLGIDRIWLFQRFIYMCKQTTRKPLLSTRSLNLRNFWFRTISRITVRGYLNLGECNAKCSPLSRLRFISHHASVL